MMTSFLKDWLKSYTLRKINRGICILFYFRKANKTTGVSFKGNVNDICAQIMNKRRKYIKIYFIIN